MEIVLQYLPILACPIIIGLGMFFMTRANTNRNGENNPPPQLAQGEQSFPAGINNASPLRKAWDMIQCCLNWKVLAGIAAVGAGLWVVAPGLLASALPVMLILLCPLSMLLMMRGMNSARSGNNPSLRPAEMIHRAPVVPQITKQEPS